MAAKETHTRRAINNAEQLRLIAMALAEAVSKEKLAAQVAQACRSVLEADAVCVYLVNGEYFDLLAESGCTDEFAKEWHRVHRSLVPLGESSHPEEGFFQGSPEKFKIAVPAASGLVDRSGRKHIAYVPLVVQGSVTGLLGFSYDRIPEGPLDESFLFTLVHLCALALERARLSEIECRVRQEAEAASKAKSEFLANVSHEIRTPLGVIQGYTELLFESEGLSPQQLQWAGTVLRNSHHLNQVLGEVLDLSKIEAKGIEVDVSAFSLVDFLNEIEAAMRIKADKSGVHLTFLNKISYEFIFCDQTKLRQILSNLISNAIKFTLKGEIRVVVEALNSKRLRFLVSDSGIGISPEHRQVIFEPFVQADSSTSRRFGGAGLGLPISRRLASAMGGDLVLLESEKGKGSTFQLEIDCQLLSATQYQLRQDRQEKRVLLKKNRLQGVQVLLVEDSEDNQDLICSLLAAEGAEVEVAQSGREGIEKAMQKEYNVILMDIQMPELDGHEAVCVLRSLGYRRPIAALTANALKSERDRSLEEGFDDYLIKPINRKALIKSLQRLSNPKLRQLN